MKIKNENIILRDMIESNIDDYVRWFTTETEWSNTDAPWESIESDEETERKSWREYARKRRWHQAQYSLDFADDIERHIVFVSESPETHFEKNVRLEQLHAALTTLSDKQAKRIYAHYFLGFGKAEIARSEGVSKATVCKSIAHGLRRLEKICEGIF